MQSGLPSAARGRCAETFRNTSTVTSPARLRSWLRKWWISCYGHGFPLPWRTLFKAQDIVEFILERRHLDSKEEEQAQELIDIRGQLLVIAQHAQSIRLSRKHLRVARNGKETRVQIGKCHEQYEEELKKAKDFMVENYIEYVVLKPRTRTKRQTQTERTNEPKEAKEPTEESKELQTHANEPTEVSQELQTPYVKRLEQQNKK